MYIHKEGLTAMEVARGYMAKKLCVRYWSSTPMMM